MLWRTVGATIWLALVTPVATAPPRACPIQLTEVAAVSGLDFVYERDRVIGGGAGGAWLDYDGDGWMDLYLVQSVGPNALYRNLADGTFAPVVEAAGAADADGIGHGVAAADYDNDGDTDLFVTNLGQNRLFRNERVETGVAIFTDASAAAGLLPDGGLNSTSAVWGDYDGDGHLDLFVANHAAELRPPPAINLGSPNELWRNDGQGAFTSVARAVGIDRGVPNLRDGSFIGPGAAWAAAWTDYDGDGDPDLAVVNDFGSLVRPNQLWRNDGPDGEGGWLFTDVSVDTEFDLRLFARGIGVGDLDNDGDLDYYVSNTEHNALLLNQAELGLDTFVDVAASSGTEAFEPESYGPVLGPVSWSAELVDLDLDGWLDLFVVSGWFEGVMNLASPLQPHLVYHNQGDLTFAEVHACAGVEEMRWSGRSSAAADFDRDGDVDLFVGTVTEFDETEGVLMPGRPLLYRNDGDGGHRWLGIRPRGTIGNRDAIGARIEVTTDLGTQLREVGAGRSSLSTGDLEQLFGLGDEDHADEVRVRWPSGLEFVQRDVDADQRIEVVEPVVTLSVEPTEATVRDGDVLELAIVATSHVDLPETGDLWVELLFEDGEQRRTLGRLLDATIEPGVPFEVDWNLRVVAAVPPGEHALVMRFGEFPGTVMHQAFVDVTVLVEATR